MSSSICGICGFPTNGWEWVSGDGNVYHIEASRCRDALLKECTRLRTNYDRVSAAADKYGRAVGGYITAYGLEHEDGCPEDSTCECSLVVAINTSERELITALNETK